MISAILITYNNEDTIGEVLEKLMWADEVIMVDAFSQDRTPEIGKAFGAKALERRWEGYASQRRYAIEMARFDWILNLDSDEVLDDELMASIKELTEKESGYDGYMVKIVTYFLNRPLRFACMPSYYMRLFRKSKAILIDKGVHENFKVAKCGFIKKGAIKHYTSQTIKDRIEKIDRYSTLEAREIIKNGKKATWLDILIRPLKAFLRGYVINLGFLDGMEGLIWTICVSMERCLIYAKVKLDKV